MLAHLPKEGMKGLLERLTNPKKGIWKTSPLFDMATSREHPSAKKYLNGSEKACYACVREYETVI